MKNSPKVSGRLLKCLASVWQIFTVYMLTELSDRYWWLKFGHFNIGAQKRKHRFLNMYNFAKTHDRIAKLWQFKLTWSKKGAPPCTIKFRRHNPFCGKRSRMRSRYWTKYSAVSGHGKESTVLGIVPADAATSLNATRCREPRFCPTEPNAPNAAGAAITKKLTRRIARIWHAKKKQRQQKTTTWISTGLVNTYFKAIHLLKVIT